ncbi:MAG: hypothetical protein LBU34_07440 [Planctomycetaceae bacterium]|jgi:hypothetical protein|nr:hypothetical protein [Planctomycetaceae bacterium]
MMLEDNGWISQSNLTHFINTSSEFVLVAAFTATTTLASIPHHSQFQPVWSRVRYGSTYMSRQCQITRVTKSIPINSREGRYTTKNVSSMEYIDEAGKKQIVVFTSGDPTYSHSHTERHMQEFCKNNNIPNYRVLNIFTEFEPCTIPAEPAGCKRMLQKNFPYTNVTWSFPYGDTTESRREGMQQLTEAAMHLH